MFFAVTGDIESNFSGLEKILTTLDEAGIHRVLHTGNACTAPEKAHECLALLRKRDVLCVQGVKDKRIARSQRRLEREPSETWPLDAYAALSSDDIEYLACLPRTRRFTEEGIRILLCHGAINSPSLILSADTPRAVLLRQREIADADIVVCGGAAAPFTRHVDGVFFVCPGPLTCADNRARYLLVNTETTPWSAECVYCAY